MMGKNLLRIYWDACCILSILNDEHERADTCKAIIDEAKAGDIQLVISPLTMAETVRPKGSSKPLPKDMRETISDFLENDFFVFANFSRQVAMVSLGLCWDFSLHARDAMHLASAIHYECDFLETFDNDLLGLEGTVPGIMIRKPIGKGQGKLL